MIPASLTDLVAIDPLAPMQAAIIDTVRTLLTGVTVAGHPGKVDVSELMARRIAPAPSITIGWSRIKRAGIADGHFNLAAEWTAYIAAEPKPIGTKRVEAETIAFAIGARLLAMLSDPLVPFWGLTGVYPPEETPAAEFKPLFTVKDGEKGVYYYTVTWTQAVIALGSSHFPGFTGVFDEDSGAVLYPTEQQIAALAPWIPGQEVPDDEE